MRLNSTKITPPQAEMIAKLTVLIVADIEMRFFDQLQNVATYADCDNFNKMWFCINLWLNWKLLLHKMFCLKQKIESCVYHQSAHQNYWCELSNVYQLATKCSHMSRWGLTQNSINVKKYLWKCFYTHSVVHYTVHGL